MRVPNRTIAVDGRYCGGQIGLRGHAYHLLSSDPALLGSNEVCFAAQLPGLLWSSSVWRCLGIDLRGR
jgi:hypothetical protein